MIPPRERDLVDEISADLVARGFAVRREVSFLVSTYDGAPQERDLDLYLRAPRTWEHYARWPLIAVEAKRRDMGSMGDAIDGFYQSASAMVGRRFRQGATDLPCPSIALYVDAQSWRREPAEVSREAMLVDRMLWRVGAAILNAGWDECPCFTYACKGMAQTTYRFPPRTA